MAKNMPSMASHQALHGFHHHRRNSNPLKSCGSSMKPLPNFNADFSSVICEPMPSRSAAQGLDVLKVEVKGTVKTSSCLHPDLRIPKRRKLDLDVETILEDAATYNKKSSSNGLLQSSLNDDVRTVIEPQASERLLRAALLKSRFADTILKAKEKMMHLANKNVSDPVTSCQERLKLETIMKEEKAKLQAEVEAAQQMVKRAQAEAISKARRESRFMLEEMEKAIENNDCEDVLEDLEMHLIYTREGFSFDSRSPLKQLGLFMKRDEDEMVIDRPSVTDTELSQQDLDIMSIESEDTGKHARVTLVGKRFADTVLKTQDKIMPLSTKNVKFSGEQRPERERFSKQETDIPERVVRADAAAGFRDKVFKLAKAEVIPDKVHKIAEKYVKFSGKLLYGRSKLERFSKKEIAIPERVPKIVRADGIVGFRHKVFEVRKIADANAITSVPDKLQAEAETMAKSRHGSCSMQQQDIKCLQNPPSHLDQEIEEGEIIED